MTDQELSQYCSVILLYLATKEGREQLSIPLSEIDEILERTLDHRIGENIVSLSVGLLNVCDISYVEDDPVTGRFINISRDKFQKFIERVSEDQARYNKIVESSDNVNSGINNAEAYDYRYLDAYNKFSTIRKFAQFGDDWARLMIGNLRKGLAAGNFIPASDRIVTLSDNSEMAAEIVYEANALRDQLLKGNDLGNLTPLEAQAAASEVAQIAVEFSSSAVRAGPAYQRARLTLEWVGKEAGGALVGAVALALLALIAKFLGF